MEKKDLSDWRKSTYSGTGGANCVEVASGWRKSTYSASGGENCVEVANGTRAVFVRDTTDRDGPSLSIDASAWREFLATL